MNPVEKTTRAGLRIKNFLWDQVCHIESQNSSHASLLAWARRSLNGSLRGARIATEGYKSFKKSKQCPRTQHWHFISLFKTRPSIGRQPKYHTLFIYLRPNSHNSSIYDTETPGGGVLLGILGGGVPPLKSLKSWPDFRPKNVIFHTCFQTRPLKSIPVFRPATRFSKVPIIKGPGKLSPFTLKIEVSIILHLTW